MTSAIHLCAAAYRQANLDQDLTSFSTGQPYPYNIALDLLNTVLQELNRYGRFWFSETTTPVSFTPGASEIDLAALSVDPASLRQVRRENPAVSPGLLKPLPPEIFLARYRTQATETGVPQRWTTIGNRLLWDVTPDQDYSLVLGHLRDFPTISAGQEAATLPIPTADEDVVVEGVYAYLLQRLGRPDAGAAYSLFLSKVRRLVSVTQQRLGLPRTMPASF